MAKRDSNGGGGQSAAFLPIGESKPVQQVDGPAPEVGSDVVGTYDPVLKVHVPVEEKPKPKVFIFDRQAVDGMLEGTFRPVAAFDLVTYTVEDVPERQADFCLMLAFNTVKPGGTFIVTPEIARQERFANMVSKQVGELVQITKPPRQN